MSEGEALQKLASKAIRRPQSGAYEQLIAQHLIKSVAADPIEKIRLILEASMLVPELLEKHQRNIARIYAVAISFDQTQINIRYDASNAAQVDWSGVVAWSFTQNQEGYEEYILPWVSTLGGLFTKDRRQRPPQAELDALQPHEYFYYVTRNAHNATLELLKSRFITHCMSFVMSLYKELTKQVNSDTYLEMLSRVKT